ncbi:hypothetical protein [Gimesia fumaroli]|nr:hypothetical protein [Gimesia fumaroli]
MQSRQILDYDNISSERNFPTSFSGRQPLWLPPFLSLKESAMKIIISVICILGSLGISVFSYSESPWPEPQNGYNNTEISYEIPSPLNPLVIELDQIKYEGKFKPFHTRDILTELTSHDGIQINGQINDIPDKYECIGVRLECTRHFQGEIQVMSYATDLFLCQNRSAQFNLDMPLPHYTGKFQIRADLIYLPAENEGEPSEPMNLIQPVSILKK